ncbi:hypothetical protein [Ideonella sp. YS5]|uniref:hypothetical protein n=1 Tax=Ideonella sp. YS5 TaxID=3453714 RepID=UPI003EE9B8E4
MAVDGEAVAAVLADEIRELEARMVSMAERLQQLRQHQAALVAAKASAEQRQGSWP